MQTKENIEISDLNSLNTEPKVFEGKKIGEEVEGELTFERYLYQKDNFAICLFSESHYVQVVVKGNLNIELAEGRIYRVTGTYSERFNSVTEIYEEQIDLKALHPLPPTGEKAIIRYLQSLDGVMMLAFTIYEKYKDESISILKSDPERVSKEIPRMSLKKAEKLQSQLIEAEESSQSILFLLNIGFTLKLAEEYHRDLGEDVTKLMTEDVHRFCNGYKNVKRINFTLADRIMKELGTSESAPSRIQAGIQEALKRSEMKGHSFADLTFVLQESWKVLNKGIKSSISTAKIGEVIEDMIFEGLLKQDDDRLYSKRAYYSEKDIASNIVRLSQGPEWSEKMNIEEVVDEFLKEEGVSLEERQREALIEATREKTGIFVLIGPAGSGKTFVVKLIMKLMEKLYKDMDGRTMYTTLLAPTGKARKVLAAATGHSASTIHSALGLTDEDSDPIRKIEDDLVVIDEASMVDLHLAKNLLDSIENRAKTIFILDPEQLPAVGPGNVLEEIVYSGKVPYVELNVVKRQEGADNLIPINSRRILNGGKLESDGKSFNEEIVNSDTHGAISLLKKVESYLKEGKTFEDFQVLLPMRGGVMGTNYINYAIQKKFNDREDVLSVRKGNFKVDTLRGPIEFTLKIHKGDRVYNNKNVDLNYYEKVGEGQFKVNLKIPSSVANGEVGVVDSVFEEDTPTRDGKRKKTTLVVAVKYDDGYVLYEGRESHALIEHAFALTIHKSQGSQWESVILGLMPSHYVMLDTGIFYTGSTRPTDRLDLLTTEEAKRIAMSRTFRKERNSTLLKRLAQAK